MNKGEIQALEALKRQPGWQLYQALLKDKFDMAYPKLRNSRRSDTSYGKLCGLLDGIEYALKVLDETVQEGPDEPQPV